MTESENDATAARVRRVLDYYVAMAEHWPGVIRTGPFMMLLDPADPNPFRNYAVPVPGRLAGRREIDALAARFRAAGRRPRLEYAPEAGVDLLADLLAAGFAVEGRLPILTCRPESLVEPPAEGFHISLPDSDDGLAAAAQAANAAYGAGDVTASDVARLRRTVAQGGLVALALDEATGAPAAAGLFPPPFKGVTEIAAIGTVKAHRRRGLAAALTARLTREAFARGVELPFLMAGVEAEMRIFLAIGYEPLCECVHISRD